MENWGLEQKIDLNPGMVMFQLHGPGQWSVLPEPPSFSLIGDMREVTLTSQTFGEA